MSTKSRRKKRRFIFVVGGVMSSVGKGVASSSIATILLAKGFRVTNVKCEMYVNIDAGTIRPTEHGEVFVCDDGIETDQDIGNYERFTNRNLSTDNFLTTGQVYQEVIRKERNLEYGGEDVEVVPDIPNEIIRRLRVAAVKDDADITIVEFGGTVGEYQVLLFLEAARMMKLENPDDVLFAMVSYLPVPSTVGEMKTKPTQHAVQALHHAGVQADFIICRSEKAIDKKRRKKLGLFCSVPEDHILAAPDVRSIYEVPLILEKQHFGEMILKKFGLRSKKNDLAEWRRMVKRIKEGKKEVSIGIVGKYFATGDYTLADSYISVIEAVRHAAGVTGSAVEIAWINAEDIEKEGVEKLKNLDGIIIPQGWGSRGAEGKITAIQYAREHRVPYFGLCYGMQMAVIEFARNIVKLKGANSEEIDAQTPHPIIHVMKEQQALLAKKQYGGTIRLGSWPCKIVKDSNLQKVYAGADRVDERHRHRYEFNNAYRKKLESAGLTISGTSPNGTLVEAVEITDHPFFIGTQFHPEYKSKPMEPHPLFVEFIKAALRQRAQQKTP